jgi:hypothetical protein
LQLRRRGSSSCSEVQTQAPQLLRKVTNRAFKRGLPPGPNTSSTACVAPFDTSITTRIRRVTSRPAPAASRALGEQYRAATAEGVIVLNPHATDRLHRRPDYLAGHPPRAGYTMASAHHPWPSAASLQGGWCSHHAQLRCHWCLAVISRPPQFTGHIRPDRREGLCPRRKRYWPRISLMRCWRRSRTGVVKPLMTKIETNAIIVRFYAGAGLPVSFVSAHAG